MRAQRTRLLGVLVALALVVPAVPASAAPAPIALPHVPGVVLVGFAPGVTASERAAARARVGATARPISPLAKDAEHWALPRGLSTEAAIDALANVRALRYAEPDWIVTTADASNDPAYLVDAATLWGMHGDGIGPNTSPYGSAADEAWARGYVGSRDVYVGIIDTGVQWAHPDLVDNFWTNAAEAAGVTGVDDDGNGRIDDLHGFDFVRYDGTVFDSDEHYHGTHVAGTIGGVGGNGIGVAGVNWRVRMISGKFLDSGGSGAISNAAAAADYLTDLKIRKGINLVATSNSWGGGGFSQTMLDAINRGGDAEILFIAAAGNGYADNDANANYPSNYQCTTRKDTGQPRGWDCMVAVAAIDVSGAKAGFSNWGATTVDLGAPGVNTYSTYPTNLYSYLSGTSMATPHVSGAVALCESINPTLTAAGLRSAVLNSTTATASLSGKTVTGGRLDVGLMVDVCLPPTAPVTGSVSNLAASTGASKSSALTWTSDAVNESAFEVQAAVATSGTCGAYSTVLSSGANSTSAIVAGLAVSTDYCFRVRAVNGYLGGSATAWSNIATARTADPPPAYTCVPTTFSWIDPSVATNLNLSDDSTYALNLPASFGFSAFGTQYSTVTVSSNGFVRPGSTAGSYYTNAGIPNIAEPNGILAAAWDDWNPTAGGTVRWQTVGTSPNRRVVVTWVDVPNYNVAGSAVSFQIVMEEGSDVVRYQYLDMVTGASTYDAGGSATVGTEYPSGEWGTQVSLNAKTIADGSAIRCSASVGQTPGITTASLPDANLDTPYSTTLAASGGASPYTWTIASGSLPAGLTLTGSTGLIAGTPVASGSYPLTFKVTGGDGGTVTKALTLRVGVPPSLTSAGFAPAYVGESYSSTPTSASGGSAPYSFAIVSGTVPAGLTFSASGTMTGTPGASTTASLTIRVTGADGGWSETAQALGVFLRPLVTTTSLPAGTVGTAYSTTLAASSGAGPYTWQLSGSLPSGLTFDGSTGTIGGNPSAAGSATVSFTAVGSDGGRSLAKSLSIGVATPPAVSTASLAGGTAGASYSAAVSATGGTTPYAWSATGLPAGLTMNANGTITGTPASAGSFSATVSLTDAAGRTASRALSLAVGFGKQSPANLAKYANTTTSVPLAWYPYAGASSYRWCASSASKACSSWTVTSGTSATVSVSAGQTWNWQVQVLLGATWTGANAGSGWKFSINR